MSASLHVVLEGLPERIQEAADILECALPGALKWQRSATPGRDQTIRLEAVAASGQKTLCAPLMMPSTMAGKPWKPSCLAKAGPERGQSSRFCASLSRSFTS